MQGALAAEQAAAPATTQAPLPEGQLTASSGSIETKSEDDSDLERWTEILDRSIERIIERQQRVVLEKVSGQKAKKALSDGTLEVDMIMPQDTWDKQMEEDVRPVLNAIIKDAGDFFQAKSADYSSPLPEDLVAHVNAQVARIQDLNFRSREVISREILNSLAVKDAEHRFTVVRAAIVGHFTQLLAKTRGTVAQSEARRAWNAAAGFSK
jgi:hypothetical protein